LRDFREGAVALIFAQTKTAPVEHLARLLLSLAGKSLLLQRAIDCGVSFLLDDQAIASRAARRHRGPAAVVLASGDCEQREHRKSGNGAFHSFFLYWFAPLKGAVVQRCNSIFLL
jgi:hypothetical protein